MKVKAINMCMACGRTVDTSTKCYIAETHGLYAHTECENKLRNLLKKGGWFFDNRKKEWKDRDNKYTPNTHSTEVKQS